MNAEERLFRDEWKGYIDPLRTSLGPSGGCWRPLVSGVKIRVCNEVVVDQLREVLTTLVEMDTCGAATTDESHRTNIWIGGVKFGGCKCVVNVLVELFRSVEWTEHNKLTFHTYNDAEDMVVSYNSGVLMTSVIGVGYVENIMFSQGLELWSHSTTSEDALSETLSECKLFCALSSLTPYMSYNPPARAALSSHYILQALSLPYTSVNYTMRPLYSEAPLVVTTECLNMFEDPRMIPGLNVLVVYPSTDLVYEDGFLMSSSCAMRYVSEVESIVPISEEEYLQYRVGSTIDPASKSWWPIPVTGTVTSIKVTSTGGRRMSINRQCGAVTGDKFATWHGQKGVVTVVPDSMMPMLKDGRVAELVIGSTTLIKRGTLGQLMESYCEIPEGMEGPVPSERTNVSPDDITTCTVTDRIPSCHDTSREVEVHCGTIRLFQPCHMTFDRHQFTRYRTNAFSKGPRAGRSNGGDVHLGEMEIQQMVGSGLGKCLEELHIKGNMSVSNPSRLFYVCSINI